MDIVLGVNLFLPRCNDILPVLQAPAFAYRLLLLSFCLLPSLKELPPFLFIHVLHHIFPLPLLRPASAAPSLFLSKPIVRPFFSFSFSLFLPLLPRRRWVRLMFTREFPLDECMELWDAIFSRGRDLNLVDYLCVSMLLNVRATCE